MSEPLLDKIKQELPEYKISALRNLLIIVLSMIQKETCNLHKLRGVVGLVSGKRSSKPNSHYQRIIRFFRSHALNDLWIDLLSLGFRLLRMKVDYLALDGTSWQYGNRKIHLLMLCVIYKGIAIPIYWQDLAKKGISNTDERKKLFNKAVKILQLSGKTLLADREYIGIEWFSFLQDLEINFIIRLKKTSYKAAVNQPEGLRHSALEKKILRSKKEGKTVAKSFLLEGMLVTIVMTKNLAQNDQDPIIYLITNNNEMPAKQIANAYFIRWKIETCFKHMKSNGFEMEKVNFENPEKARLLIALIVFAYTLAILEGLKHYKDISDKNYRNGTKYKATSCFREGIDYIITLCNNFKTLAQYISHQLDRNKNQYKSPKAIFV